MPGSRRSTPPRHGTHLACSACSRPTDLADLGLVPHTNPAYPDAMRRPFVADGAVRYVGQPVVAVIAEDRGRGADAADQVIVDYEPLACVVDPEAALTDDVLLFPEHGTNVVMRFASLEQADFSDCEVVVAERIVNQRLTAAPIEGRSGAAHWTPDGRLVHYSACQGAHPTKALLAEIYGLDPAQVRVIVPDVGGGFGAKSRTYPEELALGWYARAVGRPVRWTETRSENLVAMPGGRAQLQYARIGGTRDGLITAYQLDVVQDAGAFPLIGASLPGVDTTDGDGRLPPRQRRLHRRFRRHQHRVDNGVPRRRAPRGGGGDRADGRSLRRRDRCRPGGGSPAQLRAAVHRAVHHRHRNGI